MDSRFCFASVSPVRLTVTALAAAAVWLFAPELAQAAVTFGDIGQNVADSAKGVAKGVTMVGFASGAGMTEEYCVNPFDTPLGCRYPLPSHQTFLANLLTLLCTPLDSTPFDKDVPALVRQAIELAYEELSDKHNPRLYHSNVLPELHALLLREDIPLNTSPTWWEVVDALFDRGFVHGKSATLWTTSVIRRRPTRTRKSRTPEAGIFSPAPTTVRKRK